MTSKIVRLLLSFIILFSAVAVVSADNPPLPTPQPLSEILDDPEINKINNDALFENGVVSFTNIINALLVPLLSLAGLILFGMIIWGGFQMLTSTGDAKKTEAGKTRLTNAVLGFIIIFAAYWITQIIEIILGVSILGVSILK